MLYRAYILLPKHNLKAEVHKTDCAHNCKSRIISVSLDAQAKATKCIKDNPNIKPKAL